MTMKSQVCTVNKEYNLEVMRRLHEAIRQKQLGLWQNNTIMIPQPPDIDHCDFFLFPKLKGRRFINIEQIKTP